MEIDENLLNKIDNMKAEEMPPDELAIIILLPYYSIFKGDESIDRIKLEHGKLTRKELMKELKKRTLKLRNR